MNADVINRLEKIGAEVLALAEDLKRFGFELPSASKPELATAEPKPTAPAPSSDEEDLERAIEEIRKTKRASTAHFQRRMGWGYNHAAKIIDLLEMRGIVAPQVGAGSRTVYFDKIPPKGKTKKGKRK